MRQNEPCAAEAAPRPPAFLGQVHDELEPRSLRDEVAAPVAVHRLLGRLQPGRGPGRARGETREGTFYKRGVQLLCGGLDKANNILNIILQGSLLRLLHNVAPNPIADIRVPMFGFVADPY